MPAATVNPAPSQDHARKPPLPALTGIRTLLAINIVFFHFTPPHLQYLSPFIDHGFVFVGFFILLSGYVLSYNYADRALTLDRRSFWIARFARLYPIYLLALALSYQMLEAEWPAHSHADFWRGLVLTPFLLQGWSPLLATFWNIVGWTLSCEALLYATFPWIVRTWALRAPRLNTPRTLISLFLALWIIGLIPHTVYFFLNPDHLTDPVTRYTYAYWLRALKYTPPSYLCMFLAGITLGKLQLHLEITPSQRLLTAAVGLIALVGFLYTAVARVPYVILHGGLLLPIFAAITIGLSGPSALASIFSWRPLLVIGETTYCLYMLHFNALNLLISWKLWQRLHLAALDPWISYASVLLLAVFAHRYVEDPARKLILRYLSPKPAASAPDAPQQLLTAK